jgi:oligopeptide/dipeptide ABC transporter ATP-binding protein
MLLEVTGLKTYFFTEEGVVQAVDGVDFSMAEQETVGLVGETGSGKSVTAFSIMRLIQTPPGKIMEGKALFCGEDLFAKNEEEMRMIRGGKISMIFQDPMSSLNPVLNVGFQIAEAIELHQKLSRKEAYEKTLEIINHVGIPTPESVAKRYPHELSGGMRQRIMIAMALSCNPALLIADEPTTNLDVTIQAQILELMKKLKEEFHTSILLITHDLGIIAEMCDRVNIMYGGVIVETSAVLDLFENPLHPYSQGLLSAIPRFDMKKEELAVIPGVVPDLIHPPSGCRFHPRCPRAMPVCKEKKPQLLQMNSKQAVACFLYGGK